MAPRRIEEGVLSPVSITACDSPPQDERDLAMTKKVRRSYSRLDASFARSSLGYKASPGSDLSDTSTPNHAPEKRRSLFGFEKLLALDALADVSPVDKVAVREPPPATAGPGVSPREPDTDIPGISFAKEKRKRKKVPQIDKSKLDEWAAQMNAVFEEAEQFDLLVE
uniref:Cell division cycle associated 5 n=1 Tax=Sphenodon punctatus TaxID=8508 RepID=A0A8D0GDS4_SPHPU